MMNVAVTAATGGAGTGAAGGAALVAVGAGAAVVAQPPIPATFAGKLEEATQLHASYTARFAALRAAPPVKTRRTFIESISGAGSIELKVVEEVKETVAELLDSWHGPIEVKPIEDVFNHKLNFAVDSWAKLEALSAGMLPVLAKYKRFSQDDADVIAETTAYVANFRAIGEALNAMEARAAGTASVAAALEAELAAIKERIAAVAAAHGAEIRVPASVELASLAAAAAAAAASTLKLSALGVTPAHMAFVSEGLRASGFAAPTLELLFQATVDGVKMADMMRKCKGKGPVLIIGREATGGWLYGGFMDCGLSDECKYVAAPQSFVFTLTNPHKLPPTLWRRGTKPTGVGRDSSVILYWENSLFTRARTDSIVDWGANDSRADTAFLPREPHHSKTWTGATSWTASDVLIFRV